MIRIIDSLLVQSLDRQDGEWRALPIVPATATIERTDKNEDAGRLATVKIGATLSEAPDVIRENLVVKVGYCHGDDETYGSEDLPLAFEVSETNTVKISCSYQYPIL